MYFCPFLCVVTFYVLLFLENHSIALQQLFQWCSWYFPGGYFIKETFSQFLSHCWKLFWCFLGLTLGYAPIFFRALSHFKSFFRALSLMKFYTNVFCITLTDNELREFSLHLTLCWGTRSVFGSNFDIFTNVLRNLKDSLDICTDVLISLWWLLN